MQFSHCFLQFLPNEWKFMHVKHQIIHPIRATSINASFAFKFLLRRRRRRFVVVAVKREEKFLSVSRFWWQQEICDDVHLIKQLNKAERFNEREDVSWDDLPIKPLAKCGITTTRSTNHLLLHRCTRTQCKLITPIKPAICIASPNLSDCLHRWTSTLQFPPRYKNDVRSNA